VSWVSLSQGFYAEGNIQEAFDMYQKPLKILKDENIITKIPATTGIPVITVST